MNAPIWLSLRDVVAIHNEILAESGGQTGILNENALDSTLQKPQNLYYYSDGKATPYELAAAYGYGFVKNYGFVDGNNRHNESRRYLLLGLSPSEKRPIATTNPGDVCCWA